ncbi:2-succinylbenzoate--CoA ligase [Trichinella spiralis]|uniref:2-succinylbenzoate--CoA ligase n=1 Tax=Trichinella spiralis TaxID=6334 RepID=A0ABR3K698_TRISP
MNFSHPLAETIQICGYFYDPVDHKDDRQQQQMRTWQLGFTCACTHPSGSTGQPVNDIVVYSSRHVPHRAVVSNVESRSHLTHTRSLCPHQH